MNATMPQALQLLVNRRLAEARAMLAALAKQGDADAATMEIALTANGSGAPADWPKATELLRSAAARHGGDFLHDQNLLDAMGLTGDGYPGALPAGEVLHAGTQMTRFSGFLSQAECELLAQSAADLLAPAMVTDPATQALRAHPVRRSSEAALGPTRENLPVQAILRRIAAVTGTAVDQGEALTVLHYAPGQEYRPHLDALPGTSNQRIKTVLLYLNDAFEGGETHFPELGVTVRPRAGDALAFNVTRADGQIDNAAVHAGRPVTRGAKWLATRWIRARPFDVWRGPEAA